MARKIHAGEITERMSLVLMAAVWVLESDNVQNFIKYVESVTTDHRDIGSVVETSVSLDESIYIIDTLRAEYAKQAGHNPGFPYPRKFK